MLLFRKNTSLEEILQCAVASNLHMVDKKLFVDHFWYGMLKVEQSVCLVHHLENNCFTKPFDIGYGPILLAVKNNRDLWCLSSVNM